MPAEYLTLVLCACGSGAESAALAGSAKGHCGSRRLPGRSHHWLPPARRPARAAVTRPLLRSWSGFFRHVSSYRSDRNGEPVYVEVACSSTMGGGKRSSVASGCSVDTQGGWRVRSPRQRINCRGRSSPRRSPRFYMHLFLLVLEFARHHHLDPWTNGHELGAEAPASKHIAGCELDTYGSRPRSRCGRDLSSASGARLRRDPPPSWSGRLSEAARRPRPPFLPRPTAGRKEKLPDAAGRGGRRHEHVRLR